VKRAQIAIIGSGIIGLTAAWRLARDGHNVSVFDPTPGRGATYAAAGMLAPVSEIAVGEDENFSLQRDAVARWEALSHELADVTGHHIVVRRSGTLHVAFDASDRRLLSQWCTVARGFDVNLKAVNRAEETGLFSGVNDRIHDGVLVDNEAWIRPDEAVAALQAGLGTFGTEFVTEHVVRVTPSATGVRVETTTTERSFDLMVVCTGAAPTIPGLRPEHQVRPIRGVTVRTHGLARDDAPMVRAFVRGRPFYYVGRENHHGVLGATAEEKSGPSIEVGELERLLRDAIDILPGLEGASLTEMRVGHRPVAQSGVPFFEPHPEERWAASNGHYRHGVTLAPLAAQWAAAFVSEVVE